MFRNREFRQFAILFLVIAGVLSLVGFLLSIATGFLVLFTAAVFGAVFFLFTQKRYQSIRQISSQIDLVLHNEARLFIEELDEGELSILQCEIVKMTQRIREQNDALKREKEYLADSLADVAHQLRTPLTAANLTLSLLENSADEQERKYFVRETEEQLVRMDWLLTALLKISRLDAGVVTFQNEPLAVDRLLQMALRPLAIPMELRNFSAQLDLPAEILINGDKNWLAEALQNIFKNCMENAGEQGEVIIRCTDNPLFTELMIQDNGPGFAPEDLPRLFERFYRGKNASATGFGVGLALSKMIITRQGGSITAKNASQGGALFTLRFPK
ncbi:sensor histidine kinase [Enterococcus sp. AZ109]|uniref:sensor histidine kinase n=1 Tax=Enterococcus sp. AZ109 TaxID=2774634 RepID=UPI003F2429DA